MSTGDGVVMIGPEIRDFGSNAPEPAWATSRTFVYVDDVDDHCERARAAGAGITTEPADHGPNRIYVATDCGDNSGSSLAQPQQSAIAGEARTDRAARTDFRCRTTCRRAQRS